MCIDTSQSHVTNIQGTHLARGGCHEQDKSGVGGTQACGVEGPTDEGQV